MQGVNFLRGKPRTSIAKKGKEDTIPIIIIMMISLLIGLLMAFSGPLQVMAAEPIDESIR
jgi:hypothetical protein